MSLKYSPLALQTNSRSLVNYLWHFFCYRYSFHQLSCFLPYVRSYQLQYLSVRPQVLQFVNYRCLPKLQSGLIHRFPFWSAKTANMIKQKISTCILDYDSAGIMYKIRKQGLCIIQAVPLSASCHTKGYDCRKVDTTWICRVKCRTRSTGHSACSESKVYV